MYLATCLTAAQETAWNLGEVVEVASAGEAKSLWARVFVGFQETLFPAQ